jgi:hypothetical protein
MVRRRSRPRRDASDTAAAEVASVLPDGAISIFVAGQQQGVPSGVHTQGAAVLRSFHELQRVAAAQADGTDGRRAVQLPLASPVRNAGPAGC